MLSAEQGSKSFLSLKISFVLLKAILLRSEQRCKKMGADIIINYQKENNITMSLQKRGIEELDLVYEAINYGSLVDEISFKCFVSIDMGLHPLKFFSKLYWKRLFGIDYEFMGLFWQDIPSFMQILEDLMKESLVPQLETIVYERKDIVAALDTLKKSAAPGKILVKI